MSIGILPYLKIVLHVSVRACTSPESLIPCTAYKSRICRICCSQSPESGAVRAQLGAAERGLQILPQGSFPFARHPRLDPALCPSIWS